MKLKQVVISRMLNKCEGVLARWRNEEGVVMMSLLPLFFSLMALRKGDFLPRFNHE